MFAKPARKITMKNPAEAQPEMAEIVTNARLWFNMPGSRPTPSLNIKPKTSPTTTIESTAGEVSKAVRRSLALFAADRKRIAALGRASSSALRVQEYMQKRPIANIGAMSKTLALSVPTVTAALEHLSHLGVAKEMTGSKRNRIFSYTKYLAMVAAGTEPIR